MLPAHLKTVDGYGLRGPLILALALLCWVSVGVVVWAWVGVL